MRILLQCSAFAATVVALTLGVLADEKKEWVADAKRGQRLAERFCATCHAIDSAYKGAVVAGVPSFLSFTKLPNRRIAGALIAPHKPMPNMQLTRNEISDIIAYIIDLRRKESGLSPIENRPTRKPKYPSPS